MTPMGRITTWARLAAGACVYAISGRTPPLGYQALIQLFCESGGRSSDLLSRWVSRLNPPYALPSASGVLGSLSSVEVAAVAEVLRSRGYYVFSRKLPADTCDRLLEFGLRHPSEVREEEGASLGAAARRVYGDDRRAPKGVRYDFLAQDLLANPDVQALLFDASILAIAQAYLRSRPIADVLTMWWNTAYSDTPSEAAAQLYHFDMDRIKWLKFFIYLTDVGPENGPHTFVAGSHRTGGIPSELLKRGYARLTDAEVLRHYSDTDLVEFTGSRGTILAEDTRGLHKGRHVTHGDRLVLQLQFSNSLFGGEYPPAAFPRLASREHQAFLESYPTIYSAFRPSDGKAT